MLKKLFQEDVDMDTLELAEEIVKDEISKQMKTIDKKFKSMEEKIMKTIEQTIPELVEVAVNEAVEKKFSVDLDEKIEGAVGTALSEMMAIKKLQLKKKMEDADRDFFYRKGKGLVSDKEETKFKKELRKTEEAIDFIDKISVILEEV